MSQEELERYIAKYKEHEANRTSTCDRNEYYWKKLMEKK